MSAQQKEDFIVHFPKTLADFRGKREMPLTSTTDRTVKRNKFLERKYLYRYGYKCNNSTERPQTHPEHAMQKRIMNSHVQSNMSFMV